ncbi:MAG: cell envelope integrity protein TolA [Oligoflexia bacterium]|nr:cell envelope integrity protein TolA [Oligoflexia bacterium]
MTRVLYLFFILIFGTSCTHQAVKNPIPEWVTQLRGGDSSLRLDISDKYLFRTNYQDKNYDKEELCSRAFEMNKRYIQSSFPDLELTRIPITVEVLFHDAQVGDCSTTVSVTKQSIENLRKQIAEEKKQAELSNQKEQKEKAELERLKIKQEKRQAQNESKRVPQSIVVPRKTIKYVPVINSCCRYCSKGKACGDGCISINKMCRRPRGCACDS